VTAVVEGYCAPGFEHVADAFAANLDSGEELGASFAVIQDGATLVEIWGGHVDRDKTQTWAQSTLAPVYSSTKGVAALVMAWVVDQGFARYEDRIADFWPEFGAHGKDQLTIAQALSHQAGVPGFLEAIDPVLWLDPPACAHAIAALTPLWPPGTASGYHPLTWGYILGEIVQRRAQRSLGTILREEICAPLGIDFHIGTPAREDGRIAEIVKPRRIADFGTLNNAKRAAFLTKWASPPRTTEEWRRIEIPSANGHGTALALAKLFSAYAADGMIGVARVLSGDAYAPLMARGIEGDDLVLPFRLDWRSGVLGNAQRFYGPDPDALGHSGSGGSCAFGDPNRRLSAGYVMNKQSHYLMGDPRALKLIEALYSCLDA
jgi:CubicO group peptidase (beta-lactamase class C family)